MKKPSVPMSIKTIEESNFGSRTGFATQNQIITGAIRIQTDDLSEDQTVT